jgi:hypothetical protein
VGSFTTWIDDGAQVRPLMSLTGNDAGKFGFQVSPKSLRTCLKLSQISIKYSYGHRSHPNLHSIPVSLNIHSMDRSDMLDISALPQAYSRRLAITMDRSVAYGPRGKFQ